MIPAIIGIESGVAFAPDPAAGIEKEIERTEARASKWLHLLYLLYLLQPIVSLWLAIVRLLIISNLHSQVEKMAFSILPENMVKVTTGATGSYLVKAAMLNLGQNRVLPSGAIRTEHSTHAASSRKTQGNGTAASVLKCCIGRIWFPGRDFRNVWKWSFLPFLSLGQVCCAWENMRKCSERTKGKQLSSKGLFAETSSKFLLSYRTQIGKDNSK